MAQRANRAAVIDSDVATHTDLDLGERYVYRDRERVLPFLAENPHIVARLREADPEIALRFGERTKVSLDIEDDPEITEAPILIGFIRTSRPSSEALDLLHRLDDEWWILRYKEANDQLLFSLEFG
jgi:hypothetical protein